MPVTTAVNDRPDSGFFKRICSPSKPSCWASALTVIKKPLPSPPTATVTCWPRRTMVVGFKSCILSGVLAGRSRSNSVLTNSRSSLTNRVSWAGTVISVFLNIPGWTVVPRLMDWVDTHTSLVTALVCEALANCAPRPVLTCTITKCCHTGSAQRARTLCLLP